MLKNDGLGRTADSDVVVAEVSASTSSNCGGSGYCIQFRGINSKLVVENDVF